jgi:5-methylcytosine-specific restriction endonuclease McrA
MMTELASMTDEALVAETKRAAETERRSTVELLRLLIEVERRALHLALGYSSMFAYCTRALLLSEQAAYKRITAARAAIRYPAMLQRLAEGAVTLSSVKVLAPHLTDENVDALLDAARHKSTREVEQLIATVYPQPDVPSRLRALPEPKTATDASLLEAPGLLNNQPSEVPASEAVRPSLPAPAPRPIVAPISPRRYLLRVTVDQKTHDKLQRARALLRHSVPDGDLGAVLDRALTLLLREAERTKWASAKHPRRPRQASAGDRYVPASVRRAVWSRDEGCCAFVGRDGRCGETGFLEFHHVVPFSVGGRTDKENLELRCRAHNQHEAVAAGIG